MTEMFSGCGNLIEIDFSLFDKTLVIDMHNMFYGCKNLKLIGLIRDILIISKYIKFWMEM